MASTPSAVETWNSITGWSRYSAKRQMRSIASISAMRGTGAGMVARMAMPGGEQRRPGAGDDGIVFGVDADQRPASAGQLHHPQDFRITAGCCRW